MKVARRMMMKPVVFVNEQKQAFWLAVAGCQPVNLPILAELEFSSASQQKASSGWPPVGPAGLKTRSTLERQIINR